MPENRRRQFIVEIERWQHFLKNMGRPHDPETIAQQSGYNLQQVKYVLGIFDDVPPQPPADPLVLCPDYMQNEMVTMKKSKVTGKTIC